MTRFEKAKAINKGFSEMIWEAEMSNQLLGEFLDENQEALEKWISLEKKCKEMRINPLILACKELGENELLEII